VSKLAEILEGKVRAVPKTTEREVFSFEWVRTGNGFRLELRNGQFAELQNHLTKWTISAKIGDRNFRGERPDIESAFKAIDRIVYQEAKEDWIKIRCRNVLDTFQGDLKI
jgi:hypothetical protein